MNFQMYLLLKTGGFSIIVMVVFTGIRQTAGDLSPWSLTLPLKSYRNPIGKACLPTTIFQEPRILLGFLPSYIRFLTFFQGGIRLDRISFREDLSQTAGDQPPLDVTLWPTSIPVTIVTPSQLLLHKGQIDRPEGQVVIGFLKGGRWWFP